ncbi:MAG: hypothetical protein GKC04_07585 [Methanomicrobiales archaeon]|nr:hypothetical protein [Methanomicrobiales archaeon]
MTITDSFMTGDQFELYDNGVSIGTTPVVPVGLSGYSSDPDGALASGIYSSGTFVLPPGSHSIAVEIIQNPYDCGTAYIRVDATQDPIPAPEFPTAFVPAAMLAGLLAVVLVVRMKTE